MTGVLIPFCLSQGIHRAQFPLLEGIGLTFDHALGLFFLINREPELDHMQAIFLQHPFQQYDLLKEKFVFFLGAKTHHRFNNRPVVPASIEKNDLSRIRQFFDVTLKIPLACFLFGGFGQCYDPVVARVEEAHEAHDCASFAGGVSPLENYQQTFSRLADRVLQTGHLNLQVEKFLIIFKCKEHGVDRFGIKIQFNKIPATKYDSFGSKFVYIGEAGARRGVATGLPPADQSVRQPRQPALSLQVKVGQIAAVTQPAGAPDQRLAGQKIASLVAIQVKHWPASSAPGSPRSQ